MERQQLLERIRDLRKQLGEAEVETVQVQTMQDLESERLAAPHGLEKNMCGSLSMPIHLYVI